MFNLFEQCFDFFHSVCRSARFSLPIRRPLYFVHKHQQRKTHGYTEGRTHAIRRKSPNVATAHATILPFQRFSPPQKLYFQPSPNLSIALKTRTRNSLCKQNPTVKTKFFSRAQSYSASSEAAEAEKKKCV